MHAERTSARIVIHTNHPVAFQMIAAILKAIPEKFESLNQVTIEELKGSNWVLILDACSVADWLRITLLCHSNGGRAIVILPGSTRSEEDDIRLIYLGVCGIMSGSNIQNELELAVRSVAEGRLWFPRSTFARYVERTNPSNDGLPKRMTVRQEQILVFLMRGCSDKDIAQALNISCRTVKFHVSNILQKFHAKSRRALLQLNCSTICGVPAVLNDRVSA